MQSIRSKADALRRKLRKTVTNDSQAMTWFTANEMLELHTPSQSCRALAEAIYSDIDALFSLQPHKIEKRSTVLTNEVLVDIFGFLERAVLDTVELTSRQFKALVGKHLSTNCLRKFCIEIMNVVHAEHMLPISRLLPKHGSVAGVFRLQITSQTEGHVNDKTYFYESTELADLLAKLAEKVPPGAFANCFEFSGMTSKIPSMLEQCSLFASMNLNILTVICGDDQKRWISPQELIQTASAFASVNGLAPRILEFNHVDDGFLKTCRERGILTLDFYAADFIDVSTDGIIDFCFGPTREGREHANRCVDDLFYFDEALFHHILEAIKSGEILQHKVSLSLKMDYDDPQETLGRLRQLLLQNYNVVDHEGFYVSVVDKRATVTWRLGNRRLDPYDDTETAFSCTVEPL